MLLRIAAEIVAALPSDRLTPETTSGREGFLHPFEITGSAGQASVVFILRDFDEQGLRAHAELLRRTAEEVAAREPRARVEVAIREQYRNMREALDRVPDVVAAGEAAIRAEGLEPVKEAIRGGTDGSILTERGLPTPNLFTGGHEFHSPREWASLQEMSAAAAMLVRLAGIWASGICPRVAARRSRERLDEPERPHSLASLDGEIMLASEAMIPATDEGFVRGDGAFEVVRVYDGIAVRDGRAPRAHGALRRQPEAADRPGGAPRRRPPAARRGRRRAPRITSCCG